MSINLKNRALQACAAATAIVSGFALSGCSAADEHAVGADGCTPRHPGIETMAPGALKVAASNYPPFVILQGQEIKGLDGEVLTAAAKMECLQLEPMPLDFASAIPSVQNGRADISLGNWDCTVQRSKIVGLVHVYKNQMAIVSPDGTSSLEALKGRTVGSVDGFHWDEALKSIYGSQLKLYPSSTAMFQDYKAGRVDALIDGYGSAAYTNKQNGGQWKIAVVEPDQRVPVSVQPAQVCFIAGLENKTLRDALQENVETLRKDGTLKKMVIDAGIEPSAADIDQLQLVE
ncbi:substrate-binding periplasmic protein [Arthrobacter sp. NPDC057013]|uniref:substrate-binding periplasmic protein n=1 Tax=Arthrobacter sp. NPDC057013 TaxID=3345999 RepID=UPI0036355512